MIFKRMSSFINIQVFIMSVIPSITLAGVDDENRKF